MLDLFFEVDEELNEVENLPQEANLQKYIQAVLTKLNVEQAEVSIRITTPQESQTFNNEYRGKDRPTNVLSFPYELPDESEVPPEVYAEMTESNYIGDLLICHEVVVREANEQQKTLEAHYAHMVVHGTLHLLGYDHIEEKDAEIMEPLEKEIVQSLGFDDPYKDDEY